MAAKATDKRITMLDPVADAGLPRRDPAARISDLNGKSIGFLYNGKSDGFVLLDSTMKKMTQRFKFSEAVWKVKPRVGTPLTAEAIAEMAATCDVVVLGVGA